MKNFNKLLLTIGIIVSTSANAQLMTNSGSAKPIADVVKGVASSKGSITSNSLSEISDLTEAGLTMVTNSQNATSEKNAVAAITQQIESSIITGTMQQGNADSLAAAKQLSNQELSLEMNLANNEMNVNKSQLSPDDTKEEILFIKSQLEKAGEKSVSEVIALFKANVDGKHEVNIPTAEYQNDPEIKECLARGGCGVKKVIFPSAKLQTLYDECSIAKSNESYEVANKMKKRSMAIKSVESLNKSANQVSSSTTIANKVISQKDISCSPSEASSGICGPKTKEEYQNQLVNNIIIPNANISSSNLLSPSYVGGEGLFDDIPENVIKEAEINSLDRSEPLGKKSPEIVDSTYRNSNQLQAALDFKGNLINMDLIPNQRPTERKESSSAQFQSKYLSRMAALSISDQSFMGSIQDRVGTVLGEAIKDGKLSDDDYDHKNPIKESHNGASSLDKIKFDVQQDFLKMSVLNGSGNEDMQRFEQSVDLDTLLLESLIKSNMLAIKELEDLDMVELNLAALLANKVNSPANVRFINTLRGR